MLKVNPAVIINLQTFISPISYKHLFSPNHFRIVRFGLSLIIPTFWDTPHNLGRLLFRRNQKQFDFIWFVQNKSAILT